MELQALKLYLISIYGLERVDQLFWDIQVRTSVYCVCIDLIISYCVVWWVDDNVAVVTGSAAHYDRGQALLRTVWLRYHHR